MKKRIWELDALRGLCILGMVIVHLIYDLIELYELVDWDYPAVITFLINWGGVLFFLISGICVTLGSRSVRRGILVFLSGMLCTVVTIFMVLLDFAGRSMIIWFGVLHCLGTCMLLWPLLRKLPTALMAVAAAVIIAVGLYWYNNVTVDFSWLIPLGLTPKGFVSSDYFPLLPNLGYFLAGAVLGRTLYRKKESLLPHADTRNFILRGLCFCGRQSLLIYLLHQPILTGLLGILTLILEN